MGEAAQVTQKSTASKRLTKSYMTNLHSGHSASVPEQSTTSKVKVVEFKSPFILIKGLSILRVIKHLYTNISKTNPYHHMHIILMR